MSDAANAAAPAEERGFVNKMLDFIERVGNKVPHPVMMFVYLIVFVMVLSLFLSWLDVGITEEHLVPAPAPAEVENTAEGVEVLPGSIEGGSSALSEQTTEDFEDEFVIVEQRIEIQSLISIDGIRFIFTSFVDNFANFRVVATIFVVMIGVGVADVGGLMAALIRKLVAAAPAWALSFIIILVGGLSSVASDAGYLILIPLGAIAFLSVGRHPIAGIAAAYAGVSAAFTVNILIQPTDALLTEMTNEALQIAAPGESISITANWYFSTVSWLVMAIVMTFVTARLIEPRLGVFNPATALPPEGAAGPESGPVIEEPPAIDSAGEAKGLRYTLFGLLAVIAAMLLLTIPSGAPLRDPESGAVIGDSPFMDSLIFIISLIFLVCGICYGAGAGTIKTSTDVINAITKTFAGLAGLVFMLLTISQFVAYFNWSNLPAVIAGWLADLLQRAEVNEIILLVGLILVIGLLDIIMPGALPKWAMFAPIFVPLFYNLGVAPQTVLAAYRIGDSPFNVVTPLMVYLPFIVLTAQKYDRNVGLGSVIALMIPYTLIVLVVWTIMFVLWYLLGIPLGPGYSVDL